MPFEPVWEKPGPWVKPSNKGRKRAPEAYYDALERNPGKWARMSTHGSREVAELLLQKWSEEFPELTFCYRKVGVRYKKYFPTQFRLYACYNPSESVEPPKSRAGASVRAPVKKKAGDWNKVNLENLYTRAQLRTHPGWVYDFNALDIAEIHEELDLLK